jgi:uncharacterized protein (DUF1778 family)
MARAVRSERIEMRVDPEIKQLAERASVALGCASMTEYVTNLIRENAPKTLRQQTEMEVTNAQFDRFMAICSDTERRPSERILEAAKRLDTEGY